MGRKISIRIVVFVDNDLVNVNVASVDAVSLLIVAISAVSGIILSDSDNSKNSF